MLALSAVTPCNKAWRMAFASCHGLVGSDACWAELGNNPKPRQSKEMSLI
jgi:hypothetical protein